MKKLLPFVLILLIGNITAPSNAALFTDQNGMHFRDFTLQSDDNTKENPSIEVDTSDEAVMDSQALKSHNIQTNVVNPTSTTNSGDLLINYSSELNATTLETYDPADVSHVRLTVNLTAVGSLSVSEVPIDYMLVLDGSGSVYERGWNQTIRWSIDFVNSVKPSDRVGIITFNETARLLHSLNDNQSREYITNLLNTTTYPQGGTNTHAAVNAAIQEFINNSTDSIPKFLFLVTDGIPTSGPNPCYLESQLRNLSIKTLIIGVGAWDRNRLRCLVENPYQDMIDIDEYEALEFHPEDLSAILRNLENVTANNVRLNLIFNPDVLSLRFYSPYIINAPYNYTFVIQRMYENDSQLFNIDIDVTGEGMVPILLDTSTLVYQPINQTTQTIPLSSLSVEIIILDVVDPVVSVPSDMTVEAEALDGTMVEFDALATDDRDGDLVPVCNPPSGSIFPLGITEVTCIATDSSGNSGSASFTIEVVDTTAPNLVVPANIVAEAESMTGSAVAFDATASDIVDGSLSPVCAPASGSVFPLGLTVVDCMVTDTAGNSALASFSITIVDTTAPLVNSPDDLTVFAGVGENFINWSLTDFFPDSYEVYQNETVIGFGTWMSGDMVSIDLSSLADGVYVFRIVANDTSGNTVTDEVIVTFLSIPEQFASIREDILNLDLGRCGNHRAFLNKLDAALRDFERGRYSHSIKRLESLIHELKSYNHHKIDVDAANALIDKIERLIDNIRLFAGIDVCDHYHRGDHHERHEYHHVHCHKAHHHSHR